MTDREMWLEIARRVMDADECGYFICNIASELYHCEDAITQPQYDRVLADVKRERDRQGWYLGSIPAGWMELRDDAAKVARIHFCTAQIRRLNAEGVA